MSAATAKRPLGGFWSSPQLTTDKEHAKAATVRKTIRRSRRVRVLRVGIASHSEVKVRMMAIARGELVPSPDDPKVWFPSTETFGKVLSGSNRELLAEIAREAPKSITDLAGRTGRHVSNLSRTLKTLHRYGLVDLIESEGKRRVPRVNYDEIDVRVSLAGVFAASA
jgi:predicted transcriptional regulator